ncbi:MAG: serine/threonine protein kinase [Planctomycetaceae bacterium]|jgi:serine/threonine-protein kinase|nr:serine/threonine protein kinase [Planctomycetaceae bacterium]
MQPEKLGPFNIGRALGRGGMGVVYEGVHEQTGEVAAVKVLIDTFDEENDTKLRFEAEIETLKLLRHPNIVRLFGFGADHGLLYYVMELVEGASLYAELKRKRYFHWYEVAKIGMEMCLALRHAHDRGITHRDVKPANILLEKNGAVKLSDFGIASLFGSQHLTDNNAVVGTLEYMSPEQSLAYPVGPRSDMYSLGAVLYALILNKPPFAAKNLAEIIKKHQENSIEPMRLTRIDVPEELETIILNLLQIQPETRPQSPFAVARRFQMLLQTQFGQLEKIIIRPTDYLSQFSNKSPEAVIDLSVIPLDDNITPPNNNPSLIDSFGKHDDDIDATKSLTNIEQSNRNDDVNSTQFEFDRQPNIRLPDNVVADDIDNVGSGVDRNDVNRDTNKRNENRNLQPAEVERLPAKDVGDSTSKIKTNTLRLTQHSTFTEVNEHELGGKLGLPTTNNSLISLQTIFASVSLLLIGGIIYYLLQPVSPDTLYNRILSKLHSRGESNDFSVESLRRAESEIRYFLDHYADHPRIGQVRIYDDQLNLANLERRLERRRQFSDPASISQVERAYLEATSWIKSDPMKAIAKLQAIIDLFGNDVAPLLSETINNYEEQKNKIENIMSDDLEQDTKNANHRLQSPTEMCVELARRRLRELKKGIDTIISDQETFLSKRINDAKSLMESDPDQARKLLSGVIELYGEQSWALNYVNESRNLLNKIKPNPKESPTKQISDLSNENF